MEDDQQGIDRKRGAALKKLREEAKLTQREAAAAMPISRRRWQDWEAGKPILERTYEKLACVVGVSVQELRTSLEGRESPRRIEDGDKLLLARIVLCFKRKRGPETLRDVLRLMVSLYCGDEDPLGSYTKAQRDQMVNLIEQIEKLGG